MTHLVEINPLDENPFRKFPILRTMWSHDDATLAEQAIDEAFADWRENATDYGKIYLIFSSDTDLIMGLTGFLPWVQSECVGLRWHGLLNQYRGTGLSLEVMDTMRMLAHARYPTAAWFVEYMPEKDSKGELGSYFERAGFQKCGPLESVSWSQKRWQEYRCDIRLPLQRSLDLMGPSYPI